MNRPFPDTQRAIQLVGPGQVVFNEQKPVFAPRSRQILCSVEAVGLCFSDLKLLRQFASHPRKSEIVAGIDERVLRELPSYVPGDRPTVPGHEAAVRVCAVGEEVERFRPGERYLVQTDYRWLRTAQANAAFGYNLEGALQEYVILDERVMTSPAGEVMMLPASEALSASAIALIEPWACVEDAYATRERRGVKEEGGMLVVADEDVPINRFVGLLRAWGRPGHITWVCPRPVPDGLGVPFARAVDAEAVAEASCDDVVYFGASPDRAELLFCKLRAGGLFNIVCCGRRFGRPVTVPVGRVHYGGIRIVGTSGHDPGQSMQSIPCSGEIGAGARVQVVGAGGPMGMMHVVRDLCLGAPGVQLFACDTDEVRLRWLSRIAEPLAREQGAHFQAYDPAEEGPRERFDYVILMVPVPGLVAQAVEEAAPRAIINIFAGIPADVSAEIDLDSYLEKQLYFIGTSGSVLEDMRAVLARVEAGRLDTDLSVAAVSGLEGAQEGLRAIAERRLAGKIVVYPGCRGLGLVALEDMQEKLPAVAELLDGGRWNRRAEKALWEAWGQQR